jgi:hypothetical protein
MHQRIGLVRQKVCRVVENRVSTDEAAKLAQEGDRKGHRGLIMRRNPLSVQDAARFTRY